MIPPGYRLQLGSALDQARLVKFMQRTYEEREPGGDYAHLAYTVEQYFSHETPVWWVEAIVPETASGLPSTRTSPTVACLWVGNAIDQIHGDRHAHIFLLYVVPEHRRKGIGAALMQHAEQWARARGDRQIGLQVFQANQAALTLYRKLGFQPQSLWMIKSL